MCRWSFGFWTMRFMGISLCLFVLLKVKCSFTIRRNKLQRQVPRYSPQLSNMNWQLYDAKSGHARKMQVPRAAAPSSSQVVLKCNNLSKRYTDVPQFEDVSLTLTRGQRLGLIGKNGAGKSTLLRILAKIDAPDSGSVSVPSQTTVGYFDQEMKWDKGTSVYEALFDGDNDPLLKAVRNYFAVTDPSLAKVNDKDFTAALTLMEEHGNGWALQAKAIEMVEKLGIKEGMLYRRLDTLSGGQIKRIGLAAALSKEPDVLFLDEPTNHMDIEALEWLADYLRPGGKGKNTAIVLVTHDRYFLDRICTEILEIDRGSVTRFTGNYARYLELKAEKVAAAKFELEKMKTKLKKESDWMARQPQARQAKSKSRQDDYHQLVEDIQASKVDVDDTPLELKIGGNDVKRLGGVVIEADKLFYRLESNTEVSSKVTSAPPIETEPTQQQQQPKWLLHNFSYEFQQTDRVGIVGKNGVGKSHFLRLLTGALKPTSGSLRIGSTVRVGMYDQAGLRLTEKQEALTVFKFVQESVSKGGYGGGMLNVGYSSGSSSSSSSDASSDNESDNGNNSSEQVSSSTSSSSSSGTTDNLDEEQRKVVAFTETEAIQLLTKFKFPKARWFDRVSLLSGGERKRLQLLQVLAPQPNVLLLDEPTNDFDISTLQTLEQYLTETFKGCLLVVSHDNVFMNKVTEHLFVFEGDGIVSDFQGGYDSYLSQHRKKKQQYQ